MGPGFIAAAAVFLALGLHPFTTYPASLAIFAWLRPRPLRLGARLGNRVALCVCAYNEERIIRAKAENMLAMRDSEPGLELLIYVDAASDQTVQILSDFGDQIRVIVGPDRCGKTHGMNTLVRATDADYIVFSDANVLFEQDAIPRLLSSFQDPTVGCVCGHLIYTSDDGNATTSTGSAYWRLEEAIKDLESRTGSTMGADGSIFAIRRPLHHIAPADIIDDMFVSISILCDGHRVVRAADAYAYEETVSHPQEEFRRKVRIACQAFNVHRLLWPRLRTLSPFDQYKYVSHKLLRWLTIYLLGLAGISGIIGMGLMGQWIILVTLVVLSVCICTIGLATTKGPLRTIVEALLAFVATGMGVVQSLQGQRFQVWTPPASSRGVPERS